MIPRAIVALADEAPPSVWDSSTFRLLVILAIGAVAIVGGLWLAKRRGGPR